MRAGTTEAEGRGAALATAVLATAVAAMAAEAVIDKKTRPCGRAKSLN
jgi:type II secretory pathway component PulK